MLKINTVWHKLMYKLKVRDDPISQSGKKRLPLDFVWPPFSKTLPNPKLEKKRDFLLQKSFKFETYTQMLHFKR